MFGVEIRFVKARNARAINQFCHIYSYAPYVGGDIELLGDQRKLKEK